MATVYAPPEEAPEPPELDFSMGVDAYFEQVRAWEQKVTDVARKWYPDGGDLQGYIYRHGVADGKASYLVARTRPLELWHLDDGDAYHLPEPHLRGLRVTDLRAAKKRDERLADIFGRAGKGAK